MGNKVTRHVIKIFASILVATGITFAGVTITPASADTLTAVPMSPAQGPDGNPWH
jgi:hypothetical protein